MTALTTPVGGTAERCPSSAEHVGAMVAYHREHPDVGSAAMV